MRASLGLACAQATTLCTQVNAKFSARHALGREPGKSEGNGGESVLDRVDELVRNDVYLAKKREALDT